MSATLVSSPSEGMRRWLPAARVCWLVLTGALVVLWLVGQPALFHALQTPCAGASCQFVGFTPEQFRVLRAAGITPAAYAVLGSVVFSVSALVWLAVGLLIFLRRGDGVGMLVISFAIAINPLAVSAPPLGVLVFGPALMPLVGTFQLAGDVLFYAIFFIFPDGRFVPRWTRWIFFAGVIETLVRIALPPDAPINDPSSAAGLLAGAGVGAIYVVAFGAQVYRYRRVSTPRQRQQSKWAVLGLLTAGVGQALLAVAAQLLPVAHASAQEQAVAYVVSNTLIPVVQLVIPLSIAVAILRSRLWDIDVIIRRTLIYGTLTTILAAIYFAGVVGTQPVIDVAFGKVGGQQPVVIVATTLLVAALFTPLRRGLQVAIDRRFYRSRYDVARTLEAFGATLRTETDLAELSAHLVGVVQQTMQPEHVSLWLRTPTRAARDLASASRP